MAINLAETDAKGRLEDIRICLTDQKCDCGNEWFQIVVEDSYDYQGSSYVVACCGCGDHLWVPDEA